METECFTYRLNFPEWHRGFCLLLLSLSVRRAWIEMG